MALALRLTSWLGARDAAFVAQPGNESLELDRWAQAIAAGYPLPAEAFLRAPLYPHLLAAVYLLAGHLPDAVYLLQIAVAVAGIYALFRAGRWLGGPAVGLWAALLASLYRPLLVSDAQLLPASLAASAVGFLLWSFAAARARRLWGWWSLTGALAGLVALLDTSMLLAAPLLLPLALERRRPRRGRSQAVAMIAGFALMLLPAALAWSRAGRTAFASLRWGEGWLVESAGGPPGTVGVFRLEGLSPLFAGPLLELAGVALLALAGAWLARRRLARWAPALVFTAAWALSCLFVPSSPLPLVPALLLLAAVVPATAVERWREGRRMAACGLAAFLLAAWLAPSVLCGNFLDIRGSKVSPAQGTSAFSPHSLREPYDRVPDDTRAVPKPIK